jgi:uracil-DNA glycosylase family 4
MSLDLDKRHRAMLREMGVRVWQPMTPVAPHLQAAEAVPPPVVAPVSAPVVAIYSVASPVHEHAVAGSFPSKKMLSASIPQPAPAVARAESGEASWRVGDTLSLYADTVTGNGPRWLVLAETPATTVAPGTFDPFAGDAGRLLDNMLRATRLHQAGAVLLVPLVRRRGGAASEVGLQTALPTLIEQSRPDVVLVMGRLAAMAVLQSAEVFGKLRGQVHRLHGAKAVVTQDAGYLLRQQTDKAKVWEDLCLAMSVVQERVA